MPVENVLLFTTLLYCLHDIDTLIVEIFLCLQNHTKTFLTDRSKPGIYDSIYLKNIL